MKNLQRSIMGIYFPYELRSSGFSSMNSELIRLNFEYFFFLLELLLFFFIIV